MSIENLEKVGKQLEVAFNKFTETIQQVEELKDLIGVIGNSTEEYKELLSRLTSNEQLIELKKINTEANQTIKKSIEGIEKNINSILNQRDLFKEVIETYDVRFQKFESIVKEEKSVADKLNSRIKEVLTRLENDQKNYVSKLDRFNKAVESVETITRYDQLIKEIKDLKSYIGNNKSGTPLKINPLEQKVLVPSLNAVSIRSESDEMIKELIEVSKKELYSIFLNGGSDKAVVDLIEEFNLDIKKVKTVAEIHDLYNETKFNIEHEYKGWPE